MINELPVLSVVLVCSIVVFGCVAPDTVPQVWWIDCEYLLHEIKTLKTCVSDVECYLRQADSVCPHWEDRNILNSIKVAVDQRACKWDEYECTDILLEVLRVNGCIRDADHYLKLAAKSCSGSRLDRIIHEEHIKPAILENDCMSKCEDFRVKKDKIFNLNVDFYCPFPRASC